MAKGILQTADRALQILEIVSQYPNGLTPKELEKIMDLNTLTVHRLLNTLRNRGFLDLTPKRTFTTGMKMVELSSLKLNSIELKTEARPLLMKLAIETMQSTQLAIRSDNEAMYIEKTEPVNSIRMYSQIGTKIPLYCSAVGKVFLFNNTDAEILNSFRNIKFEKLTKNTLESPEAVLEDICKYRPFGYAIDNEEHEPGIFCIAAPVYDYTHKITAAISIAGKHCGFIHDTNDPFVEKIIKTSQEISRCMGYFETL